MKISRIEHVDADRADTPHEVPRGGRHVPLTWPDEQTLNSATLRTMRGAHCARGWQQFRKFFDTENVASFPDEIARTG